MVTGGQGSPFPSPVLAEEMPSKERNKLQDCLACKIGEEGGKAPEVSVSQACRGGGWWRRGCWKGTGMLVQAGAAWGEGLGLGDPGCKCCPKPPAFILFWGLFFCSPEFPSAVGISCVAKG